MTTPPSSTRDAARACIAVSSMSMRTGTSAPNPTRSATSEATDTIVALSKLTSSNASGETVTLAIGLLGADAGERLVRRLGCHVGDLVDLGLRVAGQLPELAGQLHRRLILVRAQTAEREELVHDPLELEGPLPPLGVLLR